MNADVMRGRTGRGPDDAKQMLRCMDNRRMAMMLLLVLDAIVIAESEEMRKKSKMTNDDEAVCLTCIHQASSHNEAMRSRRG